MTDDNWSGLRTLWIAAEPPPLVAEEAARTALRRARRARQRARLAYSGVPVAALGLLVLAASHAMNPTEAVLVLVIGLAIAGAWAVMALLERREEALLSIPSDAYVQAHVRTLRRQRRVLAFSWVVLLLELAFIGPWLMEGLRIHYGEESLPVLWQRLWLPAAGVATFALWSWRRARAIARELRSLAPVTGE